VLRRLRAADKLLNARATVNFERSETTPEVILRLREVLQRPDSADPHSTTESRKDSFRTRYHAVAAPLAG
jgi:hypothetical protein